MPKSRNADISYINHNPGQNLKKRFFVPQQTNFFEPKRWRSYLQEIFLGADSGLWLTPVPDANLFSTRQLLEKLRGAGLIHHYGEGAMFCDYPPFHYGSLQYVVDADLSSETQYSWGYSLPYEEKSLAFAKALGEALERQASYYHPQNQKANYPTFVRGDASHLFSSIPKFTAPQFELNPNLVKTDADLQDTWGCFVKAITGGGARFLPMETIYWGQPFSFEQKLLQHATSNGSGGGRTRDEATISGWLELIERDHLMLYWFAGIAPARIINSTIPGQLGDYVRTAEERYNLEIYFLDLSYDINIQTAACVVVDKLTSKISMGAKAGVSNESVLAGSLLEALAVISALRKRNENLTESALHEKISGIPFRKTISRNERIALYNSEAGINMIEQLFLTGDEIAFSDWDRKLETLNSLDHLESEFKKLIASHGDGYQVYRFPYDSKWLRELRYHAVRIYVPSLLKLHLNETLATPLSDRLTQFAASKGKVVKTVADVNPLPHFFP